MPQVLDPRVLLSLMSPLGCTILLEVYRYDKTKANQEPPHSIPHEKVTGLFGSECSAWTVGSVRINIFFVRTYIGDARILDTKDLPDYAEAYGVTKMEKIVYLIKKNP